MAERAHPIFGKSSRVTVCPTAQMYVPIDTEGRCQACGEIVTPPGGREDS